MIRNQRGERNHFSQSLLVGLSAMSNSGDVYLLFVVED
jgi:hypothetical protein